MHVTTSEPLFSANRYKRKFTSPELYAALLFAPGAFLILIGNQIHKLLDENFRERIMLAVTQVNGCAACSWAHTRMALSQGMSSEEISSFLSGGEQYIKPEEAKAILFAQHFADTRGLPQQDAYRAIEKEYGPAKTKIILAAAQVMIVGNMYGIPLSALHSRLSGRPYTDSTLVYELCFLIAGLALIPFAVLHACARWILGLPNVRFGKISQE
ncbi:MAG TPA: carboxymuconolactone decarboxylase family protein [bacterium]|nr:carboxymuconolactone decarboxylase family protein [bacterium]HPN42043.1 carboxymuconolactone decarboxylase family protein [bacterium]